MKPYILKEYGSWSVFIFSFLAGLIMASGKTIGINTLFLFIGLSLLFNSKQAFVIGIRLKNSFAWVVFSSQVISGLMLLYFSINSYFSTSEPEVLKLYAFSLIPLIYLLFLLILGEHNLFTEIAGFLSLCLSSLIAYFSVTKLININLYIMVSLFFVAGVFKVRVQLKRGFLERLMSILYLVFISLLILVLKLPFLPFLPLIDNLIYSLFIYRTRLKTTGWIEVFKGIAFLVLFYLARP